MDDHMHVLGLWRATADASSISVARLPCFLSSRTDPGETDLVQAPDTVYQCPPRTIHVERDTKLDLLARPHSTEDYRTLISILL
jgi:hypothetical protein